MSPGKGLLIPLLLLVTLAGCQCDINIGFIIESSNELNNWNATKQLVANIITGLPRHCTRVGLIIFSERSDIVLFFELTNDPYDARGYILTLQSHGSNHPTNPSLALYEARGKLFNVNNGNREDAHNVAVLITHSKTMNPDRTISMAQLLQKNDVKIISVGITDSTDEDALMQISSPPHTLGSDYYKVPDFDRLSDISDLIVDNIVSYKTTSFQGNLDIGFIIDGSGSISYNGNWDPLLKFIGSLIDRFPRVGIQVGTVIYSNRAMVIFPLNQYKELCDVKKKILQTQNLREGTNTAAGLHIAQTEVFNVNNGDRPDAPNVAIVITDGRDTEDRMNNKPNDMTLERARALHRNGVNVLCIGISDKIKEDELREISSPPHQKDVNYFLVPDAEQLEDIIDVLLVHIDIGQTTTTTTTASIRSSSSGTEGESDGETNLTLYIVLPILGGLLVVVVVLIVGCVLYKRRKRVAGTGNEASGDNNYYENHNVNTKPGMEKDTPLGSPVYDEAAQAYIYEEAAPAHVYDDVSSTLPHPRQPEEPDGLYSNATGVHPPIYDLAEPSDGAYSQVTPGAAAQQQPTRMESLYSQVQRKRSYIYAQVQKKKSNIYAQVNKWKKRNTDDTE